MPRAQKTFHFSVETVETYGSPTSPKECEEAYLRQRRKVEELIEKNKSPIKIHDLDGLIELSQTSRRTRNFEKKKKSQPARPLNKFLIFRKNYEEGVRLNKEDTKIDVVSKDAATEWKKWNKGSEVSVLFTEIAVLANKYHKYKYPDYKFQPKKGSKKTIPSSPESLKSYLSSPDMDLSSPESPSTSTCALPTPNLSPSLISANANSVENQSNDFVMFGDDYGETATSNLFVSVPESPRLVQPTNPSSSTPASEFLEAIQQQQQQQQTTSYFQNSMSFPAHELPEDIDQDSVYSSSSSSLPESPEVNSLDDFQQELMASYYFQQQSMTFQQKSIASDGFRQQPMTSDDFQQLMFYHRQQLMIQQLMGQLTLGDNPNPLIYESAEAFQNPCYLSILDLPTNQSPVLCDHSYGIGNIPQTIHENNHYLQCNEVPISQYPGSLSTGTPKDEVEVPDYVQENAENPTIEQDWIDCFEEFINIP